MGLLSCLPPGRTVAWFSDLQIVADRNEAVPQLIADVVRFRYLIFGRPGIRRHREVDELGWGGGAYASRAADLI